MRSGVWSFAAFQAGLKHGEYNYRRKVTGRHCANLEAMKNKGFVNSAKSGAKALSSRWRQAIEKARIEKKTGSGSKAERLRTRRGARKGGGPLSGSGRTVESIGSLSAERQVPR